MFVLIAEATHLLKKHRSIIRCFMKPIQVEQVSWPSTPRDRIVGSHGVSSVQGA